MLADACHDVITLRPQRGMFVSGTGLFENTVTTLISIFKKVFIRFLLFTLTDLVNLLLSSLCSVHEITLSSVYTGVQPPVPTAALSVPAATMAFVPAPSPTVVDQTTLMKKYLQFVAALTDTNTRKFIECISTQKKSRRQPPK